MKLTAALKPLTIAFAIAVPATSFAKSVEPIQPQIPVHTQEESWQWPDDVLSEKAKNNRNLESGDYVFADLHASNGKKDGKSFMDEWSFTLADAGDVTIDLFDVTLPGGNFSFLNSDDHDGKSNKKSYDKHNFTSLLDNKYLTVSLFDDEGKLLGTAGENGTLSVLGLGAGEWYTLAVSGKAAGLLGGAYYGKLDVHGKLDVASVPLSDTLPLFASALMFTFLRSRKSEKNPIENATA